MKEFKISNKGTTKLFKSEILERLTRTHFLFPVILYYLLTALFLVNAFFMESIQYWRIVYLFPLGMIVFSLVEYLIHRFIFHFNAVNEKEQELQYNIHGVHHEFPRDKDRLAMPPLISIILAFSFYLLFEFLTGKYVWLLFPGFLSGYATYLIIHYSVHRFRPPNNFLKYLWKHHSLHHYKSDNYAFSVSLPIWDFIFSTMPQKSGAANKSLEEKLPDSL